MQHGSADSRLRPHRQPCQLNAAHARADSLRRRSCHSRRSRPARLCTTASTPHHHARDPRQGSPRRPATRMWSYGPTALAPLIEARSRPAPRRSSGSTIFPRSTFSPSTTPSTAAATISPTSAPSSTSTAPKSPPKTTATPKTGSSPARSRICNYPLQQDAATLWYHDHAMGLNRLNTYAGLFGMFLIRDKVEDALNLPSGKYEIPLILYDRDFTADGQLFYPTSGDPEHPWVPEFGADASSSTARSAPTSKSSRASTASASLNTANSRFFYLVPHQRPALPPDRHRPGLARRARRTHSLVPRPRRTRRPPHRLLSVRRPDAPPHQRRLRHPRVPRRRRSDLHRTSAHCSIPHHSAHHRPHPRIRPPSPPAPSPCNEYHEDRQLHGHAAEPQALARARHRDPRLNTTEIWEFVNLTEDTHPMHLHLVRFQILDRRALRRLRLPATTKLRFIGPAVPPEPNELGWKDTVQCPAGIDHPHHRALRGLPRQIPLSLPHPRARSQRHDASLRSHRLTFVTDTAPALFLCFELE